MTDRAKSNKESQFLTTLVLNMPRLFHACKGECLELTSTSFSIIRLKRRLRRQLKSQEPKAPQNGKHQRHGLEGGKLSFILEARRSKTRRTPLNNRVAWVGESGSCGGTLICCAFSWHHLVPCCVCNARTVPAKAVPVQCCLTEVRSVGNGTCA